MTLSTRIALATKLGYWHEAMGLEDAQAGLHALEWSSPDYRQGYLDGRAILTLGEGV